MAYAHVVHPGKKVDLSDVDPDSHGGLEKEEADAERIRLGKRMADLQELLFAARTHALLIVLQGRDTSGKDGSIQHILSFINVQSCRVASFKQPSPEERAHDFLWRVHAVTPGHGEITIFNRSHYEDVLVVRVHDLVPKHVWKKRYDQINQFEELLTSENTLILKFYLHISNEEQKSRLIAREQDPDKSWKLSVDDWREREFYKDYVKAYEDALSKCSTAAAPWRIVPANHKWFRDLAITEAIVDVLTPLEKDWKKALVARGKVELAALEAFRREKAAKGDKERT